MEDKEERKDTNDTEEIEEKGTPIDDENLKEVIGGMRPIAASSKSS